MILLFYFGLQFACNYLSEVFVIPTHHREINIYCSH